MRRLLLKAAGVDVEVHPVDVDEREAEGKAFAEAFRPAEIALHLAQTKALVASRRHQGRLVLGADQILSFDSQILHKAECREDLAVRLREMSGRSHSLYSAAALAKNGSVSFSCWDRADLTFRNFSPEFIDSYLQALGDDVLGCAGGYAVEGLGLQLMKTIQGDNSTVLGLPLLPLLEELRRRGHLMN